MDKAAILKKLEEKAQACKKCLLCATQTNLVFGEGDPNAEILFIGEAPGEKEDKQGRPFVGAAGKLLDALIESVALERKDVYIANVLKCRPPGNRDPLPDEVKACWPYLEGQVQTLKPKLIVLLGRHSLERFIPGQKISEMHGKPLRKEFPGLGKQVFFPVYHPAAALYQGSLRKTLFDDFKRVPKIIELIRKEEKDRTKESAKLKKEQKKLF